jgi:hypothetical protein
MGDKARFVFCFAAIAPYDASCNIKSGLDLDAAPDLRAGVSVGINVAVPDLRNLHRGVP